MLGLGVPAGGGAATPTGPGVVGPVAGGEGGSWFADRLHEPVARGVARLAR